MVPVHRVTADMIGLIANWRTVVIFSLIAWNCFYAAMIGSYKEKAAEAARKAEAATQLASSRQQTITSMQQQQHDVAAIDAKYTRELNDAKQTITDLQRDVASGAKRLRVNAKCPVPGSTAAPGLANDASAGLTDSANRDYFTLRERIATAEKQIAGLQEYIRSIQK